MTIDFWAAKTGSDREIEAAEKAARRGGHGGSRRRLR